jgi:hypothetical protein
MCIYPNCKTRASHNIEGKSSALYCSVHKRIVFRTRDANSSINIMKLTSCWIEKQERPLCFQISSFTSSNKQKEDEKVRPS